MAALRLALFGHPVGHSRSPAIHAAFAAQTGVAVDYALIDVAPAGFPAAVAAFFAADGLGANVTLPHKQAALDLCATLGDAARRCGAVNTLVRAPDGALRGENTDGVGLLRDLAFEGVVVAGRRVAVLGAAGAARAVVDAVAGAGAADIVVADRDPARVAAMVHALRAAHPGAWIAGGPYAELADGGFDLVVNATSASLRGELPPLPAGVLARGGDACDLVYADAPTPFLEWATSMGATRAFDGWGMLVEQAAESFALWTGRRPDPAPLRRRR